MKVIFFGSGNYAIPVIDALKKEFDLFVFTTEKEKQNPLIKYLEENNINYKSTASLSEKDILKHKASLGILTNFRLIIAKSILDLFPLGILNIHPSLLPKYRGAIPGQEAILNNDKTTGVSIIKLDEKMDHGPILIQKEENIKESDTANSLYQKLFEIGADLLSQNIKQYIKGDLKLTSQDDKKATYTKTLTRQSGFIDINNPPKNLKTMIKAYFPWPGVWTIYNKKRIKFLPDNKVQVEGKSEVNYKDFINGYENGQTILEQLGLL